MLSTVLLVLGLVSRLSSGEVFTALVEMEVLLDTEVALVNTLERYISVTEAKLEVLRRHLNEFRTEHQLASRGIQEYLNNPINAYLLTKRLTSDWKEVERLMVDNVGFEFIENITIYRHENRLKFPTDEDLNGAAVALLRLQDTYKLDTSSVARGELNGVQYSTQLSSNDCFELGRQSYQNKDFYHTLLWMNEAMGRYHEEKNKTTTKPDILEYLAFSSYMQGNIHRALLMTNDLLQLAPNHERALGNKMYYEDALKTKRRGRKREEHRNLPFAIPPRRPLEHDVYEQLCRGAIGLSERKKSQLKCRYLDRGIPRLRIAPFKLEEAYLDPLIVIFHDVITDAEIATFKNMSIPRFRRATVHNPATGQSETGQYRVGKSAWLDDEEHEHVAAVARRVDDMTGLNVETAESLQVVNYGIGGHYEPHFDFAQKEESKVFSYLGVGNRIATVLFYMSDVEQGGATVFPPLGVALYPRKGTAALWYNLLPGGEGDFRTKHAACPVLMGSKWVCNKWIHECGQEWRRPCGLTEDEEATPLIRDRKK